MTAGTDPELVTETPSGRLSEAQEILGAGDPAGALEAFRSLDGMGGGAPTERFIAALGEAQAQYALGETSAALATLTEALGTAQGVPTEWIAAGKEVRAALVHEGRSRDALAPLQNAVDLRDASAAQAEPEPAAAGKTSVRIAVSTERYLLTVFRGDKALGAFPVGLGRNDSTPEGDFEIANKIVNPDWFNRGNVVKSGDPSNPLGSRWMGLGDQTGATSYGIHPTTDPDSIGKAESRGCIRMWQRDAEKVFGWCPVGTPVHIGP
jgi:lipoprotein-anchoring transpeptidase ErfK/SrfK